MSREPRSRTQRLPRALFAFLSDSLNFCACLSRTNGVGMSVHDPRVSHSPEIVICSIGGLCRTPDDTLLTRPRSVDWHRSNSLTNDLNRACHQLLPIALPEWNRTTTQQRECRWTSGCLSRATLRPSRLSV